MRAGDVRTAQSGGVVLVTGVTGFLGWQLVPALSAAGFQPVGTIHRHRPDPPPCPVHNLDLNDFRAGEALLRRLAPAAVIHAAAAVSPAWCERHPAAARRLNRDATAALARAAAARGCRFVFTSTDRVFAGDQAWYREQDAPAPLGVYGASKVAGEEAVLAASPENIVVRLPLMYGPPSPWHESFLGWMLRAFREKSELGLFLDQYRTPALVGDVAGGIVALLAGLVPGGIYHLGGEERVNRAEFGYAFCAAAGRDPGLIRPVLMSEKADLPPTPFDVSLNSDKLAAAVSWRCRGIRAGLREFAGRRQ